MSADRRTFAIVGAGLAGAKAAETLRDEGFDGRVVLLGAEPDRPYDRPPLSKEHLRGEKPREEVFVHPEGFYAERDIELRTDTTVAGLDAGARRLALAGGEELAFDALLLATGAQPRRLDLPGADLDGIHVLRTLADSEALRERVDAAGRLVVIGAGWIGAEVAASARQRGAEVCVIAPESVPLERVLGAEVGAIYRDVHREHGVQLRLGPGQGVAAFEGDGRVERVRTPDGETIACDAVLLAVGVRPRVELARDAGLAVGDGILVDARLQTSTPQIFAAGDVAAHDHPRLGRLRVEHWDTALHQGPAAARAMLGAVGPYERLPYFFSDQYDVGMEYSGFAPAWDRVTFRGDVAAREFVALWEREGRLVAAMNVNVWDVHDELRAVIEAGGAAADVRVLAPATPTT